MTSVRLKGYRETMRALNKVNREAAKTVRDELKQAADPVVSAAQEKISRFAGASTGTIGPRASVRGVFVTQRAKKVTGKRGDFGHLQQVELEASLDEHQDDVVRGVEGALDRLTRSAGF